MKRNRLYIIIFLCSVLSCLNNASLWAEQAISVLRFNQIEFQEALASIGRLEVAGDNLYLVDKDGVRIGSSKIECGLKIACGDVDDELLSVSNIAKRTDGLTFSVSGDDVRVGGLLQPTVARLFSVDGRLVVITVLSSVPEAQLSLAALSKGIYILQINTSIFKIQKK